MEQHKRYKAAKKVTLLGAFLNIVLGIVKSAGGIMFHSHALLADGVHSFADLVTDFTVIFASKYGGQKADSSHPYGHQRIETAATLLLSLALILAGSGIAWDAIDEIIHKTHDMPKLLALPIALFSIIANEALFQYTLRIGKAIKSELVIANAWHHRSDGAASLVVLIGLIGSYMGFLYLDALAAIIVGLMIIQMGLSYGWNSVKELVDTAVNQELLTQIENMIKEVDGVMKIHQLRSRSMGPDVYIDVHIQVSPYLSVSEGHYIAQKVHERLVQEIKEVQDVTVHIDPEDDESVSPSIHLPNRNSLDNSCLLALQEQFPEIQSWVLHYLDGKITVDLLCAGNIDQEQALEKALEANKVLCRDISSFRIFKEIAKKDLPKQ